MVLSLAESSVLKTLHTFTAPVRRVCVTERGLYAVVGNKFTPIPDNGGTEFSLELPGLDVFAPSGVVMRQALHPPGHVVFTSIVDGKCVLNVWTGTRLESIPVTRKIHSLACPSTPQNLIFAAVEDAILVFTYTEEEGIKLLCENHSSGIATSMWVTMDAATHSISTKSNTACNWSVSFQSATTQFRDLRAGDPFDFMFCWASYGINVVNRASETYCWTYHLKSKKAWDRKHYTLPAKIKDLGVWKKGIVLLLENGEVIISSCTTDLGNPLKWIRINQRPFSKITVWKNRLLLVCGCSVYEYPLPEETS